jgi:hypothetical protein
MLDPHGKLNGVPLKVAMGTKHCRLVMIFESDPSQLTNSVVKVKSSLSRILMMYEVIGEPLLSGKSHLIITSDELIVVVGAEG